MKSLTELIQNDRVSALKGVLGEYSSLLVAFSGGADSSFLLKAAVDFLGRESVLAVTASGAIHPEEEISNARQTAREIGVEWLLIEQDYIGRDLFRSNPTDRCYHCKRGLFRELIELAEKKGLDAVADGSIMDDTAGHRPGRKAGEELEVKRPLEEAGITKKELRQLSKKIGLSTWNRPSNACLATRVPFGEEITEEKLTRIENAESALRDLGFSALRVRHHEEIARIEVPPEEISRAAGERISIVHGLKEIGFDYVTLDLEGYRSGSLTETIKGEKGTT